MASERKADLIQRDPYAQLKEVTDARIALGRAGGSLATSERLRFWHDHALARDAVQSEFRSDDLAEEFAQLNESCLELGTAAKTKDEYLCRPDLGRQLSASSRTQLQEFAQTADPVDLAIILADGLSALAVHRHGVTTAMELAQRCRAANWSLAPHVILSFGRVAAQDEIGQLLQARAAVILIGERPGLGTPDSLGAYLVYDPTLGKTDADRNCVSNIRSGGQSPHQAADTLCYLLGQAFDRGLSGVELKDERSHDLLIE